MPLPRKICSVVFALGVSGALSAQPAALKIEPGPPPIKLAISGKAGGSFVLQRSVDLRSANPWEVLVSGTLADETLAWIDRGSVSSSYGFYRLISLTEPALPAVASNFRLIDHEGKTRELAYYSTARAIVLTFIADLASVNSTMISAIQSLRDEFGAQGVLFWMVEANQPRDRDGTLALAKARGIDWPVLQDRALLITRDFGVTAAPEAVCISASDAAVFYRGAINDAAGGESAAAAPGYLAMALKSFLANQRQAFDRTRPTGAAIPYPASKPPVYETDIAPLLRTKCVHCHSPGNIAPWAMTNYAVVKEYSASIRQEVLAGRMPPWHADPEYGVFSNDVSLQPNEAATLLQWIKDGAPRGEGPDPLAVSFSSQPPPTDYPFAWPTELGQPDYVVSIPRQSIPATGEVAYRYPQVTAQIPSNVWLRAAVILPGNPQAVHHSLVFTGSLRDIVLSGGGLGGYFAGYVPGQRAAAFPEGTGKLLLRNASLTFQMHYTTTGQAATDQTRLGLYFMKSPPALELKTGAAATVDLQIPPGESDYQREAQIALSASNDIWLYELAPHMHYRGAWFNYEALYPNGASEVLLSVPQYDFHWQTLYRFAQPKRLPAGTIIRCRGAFDNSAQNADNPNPSATIRFGEQTDDEMFIGYFNYSIIP